MAASSGRGSKRKGKSGENEVVEILVARGFEARRTPGSGGGPEPGDIAHNLVWPDGSPVHIEVKRREKTSIWEWWQQAVDQAPEGSAPMLVFRRNNSRWLKLTDFEQDLDAFLGVLLDSKVAVYELSEISEKDSLFD